MIIDEIKNIALYRAMLPGIDAGLAALEKLGTHPEIGRYEFDGGYFMVQEGTTNPAEGDFEAHRKYIDVQIILEGEETVFWTDIANLKTSEAYDEAADKEMLSETDPQKIRVDVMKAGTAWAAFPQDAHKPGRHTAAPSAYRKVVMKLPVA